MLDTALAYLARGWSVIPLWAPDEHGTCNCWRDGCPSPGKHPALDGWATYYQRRATPDEVTSWFRAGQRNVGIATGAVSGGLLVLDCDDHETYNALCYLYPELATSLTCRTGKGFHIYTVPTVPVASATFRAGGHTHHVQGDGKMVVAPPSLHAERQVRYEWADEKAEPLALDPQRLAWALSAIGGRKDLPAENRTPAGEYAVWLREGARLGERDERTFRLASHLLHKWIHEDEVEELLTIWAESRCDQSPRDPWGREQVRAKIRSARRPAPGS